MTLWGAAANVTEKQQLVRSSPHPHCLNSLLQRPADEHRQRPSAIQDEHSVQLGRRPWPGEASCCTAFLLASGMAIKVASVLVCHYSTFLAAGHSAARLPRSAAEPAQPFKAQPVLCAT